MGVSGPTWPAKGMVAMRIFTAVDPIRSRSSDSRVRALSRPEGADLLQRAFLDVRLARLACRLADQTDQATSDSDDASTSRPYAIMRKLEPSGRSNLNSRSCKRAKPLPS